MEKNSNKPVGAMLFASPVVHSLSPLIHQTAFQSCGLNLSYGIKEVDETNLSVALTELRQSTLLGVNLSMPNKVNGMTLVDEVTESAHIIGAINTVENSNGYLIGHNTDGQGFINSVEAVGLSVVGKKVVVLGCGGAALAVIHSLLNKGVSELVVVKRQNTTFEQTRRLINQLGSRFNIATKVISFSNEAQLQVELNETDLLINGTNIGMGNMKNRCPIPMTVKLKSTLIVFDMIYEPRETVLLEWAKSQGCQTYNGLGMLVYQAAAAFEIWTGRLMPVETIFQELKSR